MRAGAPTCRQLAALLLIAASAAASPAAAQTPNVFVAFGDSITAGVGDSREPDEGYPTRLEALLRQIRAIERYIATAVQLLSLPEIAQPTF